MYKGLWGCSYFKLSSEMGGGGKPKYKVATKSDNDVTTYERGGGRAYLVSP